MKTRIGIITTVLALSVSHGAMASSGPVAKVEDGLTLGGFLDFQAIMRDQDLDTGKYSRDTVFRTDSEIHITYQASTDNGLVYGAMIELEAGTTAADNNEGLNADKTYIFVQNDLGRLELGSTGDAAGRLSIDGASNAAAAGGVHGDYHLSVHFPDDASHHHIKAIYTPTLPLAHAHGISEDAAKISYYSPSFSGFQIGGSFIPDSGNGGTAAGFTSETDSGNFENVFNLAANYKTALDNHITLGFSVAGEFGDAEDATEEDLAAYTLGASVAFNHFSINGSYGDWGESTLSVGSASDDGKFWSLGAAYEYGHGNVSISYIDSEIDNNEMNNISLGADYQLAPGLTPYIEANFFDITPGDTTISSNDGTVVLIGTQINF
jgi:outer membrane protein OmpU